VESAGVIVREASSEEDDRKAARLMAEYLSWGAAGLREEYGIDEPPGDPREVLDKLGAFKPPDGSLILAEADGATLGVGALRRLRGDVAEVKRMYVVPAARGRHVGSAILDRLIETADEWGCSLIRLDTVRFMSDAQGLYRSRGFVECAPYEGTEIPPEMHQHWLFFERPI
jgi:GNAT superfamily N-acetyltransferase